MDMLASMAGMERTANGWLGAVMGAWTGLGGEAGTSAPLHTSCPRPSLSCRVSVAHTTRESDPGPRSSPTIYSSPRPLTCGALIGHACSLLREEKKTNNMDYIPEYHGEERGWASLYETRSFWNGGWDCWRVHGATGEFTSGGLCRRPTGGASPPMNHPGEQHPRVRRVSSTHHYRSDARDAGVRPQCVQAP